MRSPSRRLLRAALDPGLLVWSLGQTLALPFGRLKVALRRRRRRAVDPRWAPADPPEMSVDAIRTAAVLARPGPHVVFTGLGYGEFAMIRRVADALEAARPGTKVSVALRDKWAIGHVRSLHPDLNVSWWPTDARGPILRWLAAQRPDLVVLTEGCRQTAFTVASARYGARVAVMNGRLRDRRAYHRPLACLPHRWLFRNFDAMAMQGEAFADVVRDLVRPACDLVVSGDLKTDFRVPPLDADRRAVLDAWLASDLALVAAGSTDNVDEEAMVVAAFRKTRKEHPCRLLLAPRHPTELGGLPELLRDAGLTFSRRSENGPLADVLLLDTQGELSNAYGACVAAYVGGSYAPRSNGHNPIEPLASGVPVAYGMRRGHFEAIQTMLEAHGAATRVSRSEELAAFWGRFLGDPVERDRVAAVGARLVEEGRGAVAKTAAMLLRQIDRSGPP